MTKAKISEYDAVAANNTDVNGVNIAEGCPPSGMNNMGREIMAALKRFQTGADGDSLTVGGGLSVDGAVVFNDAGADVDFRVEGDTEANLLFVDASTNRIGIGTNSPQRPLHISAAIPAIRIEDSDTNAYAEVVSNNAGDLLLRADQGNTEANSAMQFEVDGTERMRIDNSGNVGIGTSSPAYTFDVTGRIHNYTTASSTGTVLEKDRAMTSVSGNVAFAAFPHALFLYNADTTTDTNIVTLGFGVNTSGAQSNAVIAGESTAAGDMDLAFYTESGNSIGERMRIDSSGNFMVATTGNVAASGAGGNEGFYYQAADFLAIARSGGQVVYLNRLDSDGSILEFRKDGSTVGTIGVGTEAAGSGIYVGKGDTCLAFQTRSDNSISPFSADTGATRDNAIDLGNSAARFDDIYATNGTIQTSDRNEKQDIEELTEAETRVAVSAKGLLRKYRWKKAVAEKGDDARIHFGIIAQDLQAAFEAEGLDAGRYAMFIKGEWWEKERVIPAVEGKEAVYETQTDEEGNETQVLVSEAVEAQPERTVTDTFETEEEAGEGAVRKERMGIRYNELLAFIIAAI